MYNKTEENGLRSRILTSQITWWSGLMVFCGIAMGILISRNNQNLLSTLLIMLYFMIATLSIYLSSITRGVYRLMQERETENISNGQKQIDIQWAGRQFQRVKDIEKILSKLLLIAIILTFAYIILAFS